MYLEIYFILFIFAVYVYPISCIDNNNNNETQFLFQLHKVKLPKKDTRLRKLFPNMTKVYGNTTELNYYFINMQVGLPPVKQSLIVDTGSQLTAIPCGSKCPTCGSHSNVFYELKNESKIDVIISIVKRIQLGNVVVIINVCFIINMQKNQH